VVEEDTPTSRSSALCIPVESTLLKVPCQCSTRAPRRAGCASNPHKTLGAGWVHLVVRLGIPCTAYGLHPESNGFNEITWMGHTQQEAGHIRCISHWQSVICGSDCTISSHNRWSSSRQIDMGCRANASYCWISLSVESVSVAREWFVAPEHQMHRLK